MNAAFATIVTTMMFLSAGAFTTPRDAAPDAKATNVTVINKNSNWPLKGQITTDSCQYVRCLGV